MALHDTEEFHHDLRGRANEYLALSTTLSVDNAFLQNIAFREKRRTEERTRTDTRTIFKRKRMRIALCLRNKVSPCSLV